MAESYHTNLPNVAAAYIRQLHIPVIASSLKHQLNEKPFLHSLRSLSNRFTRLHNSNKSIENNCFPFIRDTTGRNILYLQWIKSHIYESSKKCKDEKIKIKPSEFKR